MLPIFLFACAQKNGSVVSDSSTKNSTNLPTASEKITVRKGDTFEIRLGSIPGTGYSWEFRKTFDETVLKLISKEYVQKTDEEGMPGEDVFTFQTLRTGNTNIVLWYIRPWMTNNKTNPEVDTRIYELEITGS